ncbi:MAG: helix-turn-helix domain-containing protein [Anaerolineales bacterium]|nr:helix-turn-helix domain-containing protein [Rhodocyclaceae bacterium]MCW5886674.1 helix-turn-helix domain-containing protein [Anaerolineales bacterium]
MSTLAEFLKEEISRIARKELRAETNALKKTNSRYRSEIAELKRRVADTERQVQALQKLARPSLTSVVKQSDRGLRFSSEGLRKLRKRHGLSAAALGEIVGASLQTIYNWESGKTRPPKEQIVKIAVLRKMSTRDVQQRLGLMRSAT